MKRYYHSSLSGSLYLTYSLGSGRNERSCLDEYLASIKSSRDVNSCYRRISQLAEGTLVKRWEVYHPYIDWKRPLISVVKYPGHRFFLVYDTNPILRKRIIVYIHCCKKKSQKTPKSVINRCMNIRDFYFDNLPSIVDIEENIEE